MNMPWHKVWLSVLLPSIDTYQAILKKQVITVKTAVVWLAIISVIGVVEIVGKMLISDTTRRSTAQLMLYSSPALVIMAIFLALGCTAISNWLGKQVGGTGTYTNLLYIYTAVDASITIIALLLNILGVLLQIITSSSLPSGILLAILNVYHMVLVIYAAKAVHNISWGRSLWMATPILVLGVLEFATLTFSST